MMRIGCLLVLLFPLAARLRSEPDLAGKAVVITTGNGATARVVAVSRRARQTGVRPGQTLSQARSRIPRLLARARDPECERSAQESLLDAARNISPRVESAGEGVIYLDLSGFNHHFDDEQSLGRHLITTVETVGLTVRVGIASNKSTARVAATSSEPVTVVPPNEEAAFLSSFPLSCLEPDAELGRLLARWGIHSVGDLARLPLDEVASRLGRAGQQLHALANGKDADPLVPTDITSCFREGTRLEWPLSDLEPFLFIARSALERLCRRLESRGLACARLGLSLYLDPEGQLDHHLDLPAPTRDVKSLLTLLRLRLEEQSPGAPVIGFVLLAHPDRSPESQLSLFGPESLSPGHLAATLARLFALLGTERVGSPRSLDLHRPEGFQLIDFTPPSPPEIPPPSSPSEGRGLLTIRLLRPPVSLDVLTGDFSPHEIRPLQGEQHHPHIRGRVRVAAGPWSLGETWWSKDAVEREYWDVELSDGGLYRVYRHRKTGHWYADGIYD